MSDPMTALQAALGAAPNSNTQANYLSGLRESLERNPLPIKVFATLLIARTHAGSDFWLLKDWCLDLFHFALTKSTLSIDDKTWFATQILDSMVTHLGDPSVGTAKMSIQILTSIYPLLYRHLCITRQNPAQWQTLSSAKAKIVEIFYAPQGPAGLKFAAMKFVQRVLLVQTKGVPDPRLQNKTDPSLSMCPTDHPFISVSQLEQEGTKLLEGLLTVLYTSTNVDLLTALMNSWANLMKLRPALTQFVVEALRYWFPSSALVANNSFLGVRSLEKSVRILLTHMRTPANASLFSTIDDTLAQQVARMQAAAEQERQAKLASIESKKRPLSTDAEGPAAKRAKLESGGAPSFLSNFDFTTLPATLITDLVVANIQHFSTAELEMLVTAHRQKLGLVTVSPPTTNGTPTPAGPSTIKQPERTETPVVTPAPAKLEPVDPLKMDFDQEEMEFEPDRLNDELAEDVVIEDETETAAPTIQDISLQSYNLPPPPSFSEDERRIVIKNAVSRISGLGLDTTRTEDEELGAAGSTASEMWVLLVLRMITRVTDSSPDEKNKEEEDVDKEGEANFYERQDGMRARVLEYVMADFTERVRFASAWMNEEWYNDQLRSSQHLPWRPNYDIWLNQILASYQTVVDGAEKAFTRFLLDLPSLNAEVFELLRDFAVDTETPGRMQVGFVTLRGLVGQRPALRTDALQTLLDLTTHPERMVRGAAINTVKLWVPNQQPMDTMIRTFATHLLRKLQPDPSAPRAEDISAQLENKMVQENWANGVPNDNTSPMDLKPDGEARPGGEPSDEDENMEDGQLTPEELIQTPYLTDRIQLPADQANVLQHVELLFALSVKAPDLLDEIFVSYSGMDSTVQEAIQDLITALIKSLGPGHAKLLTLLRTFPPGAESLALRVIKIFTENGRPSPQIVALVKGLVSERDLDARFLIPIIGEMDQVDILRHLPKIVSMLNGTPEPRNIVKSVFSSIVTTPPQTFGTVSTNMPRVKQNELLKPVDLMVLLHDAEKEIGVKSAIEAIGVCFSMTDVFRSEILAAVMQNIVDKPVLPVLFMRTVIQAVTTYKTLIQFVSTTLFSRLITKKIWTQPLLWEGFIRCAKVLAPHSFGALLQLPIPQLKELVDKQPSLKSGLRDYVIQRTGNNKARVAGFLDILGEPGDASAPGTPVPMDMGSPSPQPTMPSTPEVSS